MEIQMFVYLITSHQSDKGSLSVAFDRNAFPNSTWASGHLNNESYITGENENQKIKWQIRTLT